MVGDTEIIREAEEEFHSILEEELEGALNVLIV